MVYEDGQRDRVTQPKVGDLGRYRLIAELARGGMGVVYLALVGGPGGFNKLFVVKELKAHLAEDPALVRMFVEEARLAAKLNHPNVVQTIEVGNDGNRHFIAMEFLDGQSLSRALNRARRDGGALPLNHQLYVLAQLLEGLHYAHEATDFDGGKLNLVHRDVSPHNVFITYEGQVKILDFGIAKSVDSTNETRTGVLKGTVAYMAPEQSAGGAVDRRSDLFSVGVMLWEAAVGQRMWSKSQNDMQILHSLMSGTIPRPREANADIDPALERIILKATAFEPEDRYASAVEFQGDVEVYLDALGQPSFGGRDLGRVVGAAFAWERAQIKSVVDEQLRLLRSAASGEYGAIDLPLLSTSSVPSRTPSGVLLAGTSSEAGGASGPVFRAAFDVPLEPSDPNGLLGSLRRRGGSRRPAAFVAVSLLLLLGSGALVLRSLPSRRAAAELPSSPLRSESGGPIPPRVELVQATVVVQPRGARISVDDRPPQSGVFAGTFPRDGATHAVRVDAPHYHSELLSFAADADRRLDVSLAPADEPDAAAPPGTHAHTRNEGRPAAPATVIRAPEPADSFAAPGPVAPPAPLLTSPTPTAHARQQIDTRDPYAN